MESKPKNKVNDFAEVMQNKFTHEKSLHAIKSFLKDEVICTFSSGEILKKPTYLTIQINNDKHITLQPSLLQFTNHSCEPNVFFNTSSFELTALKNIFIGDELTFFYPSTEWDMAQGFNCRCGSENCLKEIKGAKHISKVILSKYKLTNFINESLKTFSFSTNLKIFVLAPSYETNDETLDYYYDFSQSIEEYRKVFEELKLNWQWTYVTIDNFKEVILNIKNECSSSNIQPLFFNLCDGDELNKTPGISVIQYLNELQLNFTGSDEYFYNITTSKKEMKVAFDAHKVSNAAWKFVNNIEEVDENIFEKLGSPLIIKPAISAGSMGIGVKNVVHNIDELKQQLQNLFTGYKGWNLNAGGFIIEQFIVGSEFTVLISGDFDKLETAKIYKPVERVFHNSLTKEEKFLSFDRLWETYEDETQMPNAENFYEYEIASENLFEELKQISWNAFVACKGKSYGRVDLRIDEKTNKVYVLEVNAQCGLSEDENFTSIGAILKFNKVSFTNLVKDIIENCLR